MPEIEITDDQREYLEDLRGELEEDVVYGHVRLTDALQFLIDSREGAAADLDAADSGAPATQEIGDGVDEGSADDGSADDPGDATEGTDTADESGEENAEDADPETGDEAGAPVDEESDAEADAEDTDEDAEDAEDAEDEDSDADDADADDADADDADADDTEDEDAEPAAAPTPGGGGDRLNTMMQLLDTHEEKWREGSGDARYEVDLPDGSTETANTKDDVRALLFKNY